MKGIENGHPEIRADIFVEVIEHIEFEGESRILPAAFRSRVALLSRLNMPKERLSGNSKPLNMRKSWTAST